MARAMRAPWRTKSTGSEARGSRRSSASLLAVAAHAIPSACVAPYLHEAMRKEKTKKKRRKEKKRETRKEKRGGGGEVVMCT